MEANPFGDQAVNPYAAPATAYSMAQPEYSGGVFRLPGNRLVLHRQAALPGLCIKTGAPAETFVKKTLYWHHPALVLLVIFPGLLIYAIVALIVRKSMTFSFPITYQARGKLRMRIAIGAVCLILSFVAMFGGLAMSGQQNGGDGIYAMFGVLGFFALLITSIVFFFLGRLVTPTRITDQFTIVKGVSPAYLAKLPDWPYGPDVP